MTDQETKLIKSLITMGEDMRRLQRDFFQCRDGVKRGELLKLAIAEERRFDNALSIAKKLITE